jgi:hypothetical protein
MPKQDGFRIAAAINHHRAEDTMTRPKPAPKQKPSPVNIQWIENDEGFWIEVLDSTQQPAGLLGEFTIAVVNLPRGAAARLMAFHDAVAVPSVRSVIDDALDILADTGAFRVGEESLRQVLRDAFNARGWGQATV